MKSLPRVLALLLALLLPLCALGEAASEWEDVPYIAFSEPYGYSLINIGPGCRMEVGQHSYLFLKATKEETRSGIIAKTEAALTALQAFGAADRAYTIHVVKGSYAPRVDGDTLYIGTASYNTAAYVTGLAGLVYGNGVNYGLLYGVSCVVAESLGIPVDAPVPLADALSAFTGENRAYLDLNYACFIAPYADELMQANVQSVSRAFAASLTAEETASLLGACTDDVFYTRLSRFLAANGQEPYDSPLTGFSFHGGGDGSVRLRWETENARYVLDSQFEDFERSYSAPTDPDWNPGNGSYPQLREELLRMEEALNRTQAYCAPYAAAAPLTIWLENQNGNYRQSYNRLLCFAFYDPLDNTIHLGAVDSLGHEYVHAIMDTTDAPLAMEECLAYYYDYFVIADLQYGGFATIAGAVAANDNVNFLALVDALSGLLGHEVDFHDPADYLALMEAMLVQSGGASWEHLSEQAFTTAATGLDTAARFAFWAYLQECFGKELSIRALAENDPALLDSPSWEALCTQWNQHLTDTYGRLFDK